MNDKKRVIVKNEDIGNLLDSLIDARSGQWWNAFYLDKKRDIPFFIDVPDENLVQNINDLNLNNGYAIDIGCGNGRNSLFLANKGLNVIGIDFSSESISYAKKNHSHVNIDYRNISFFEFNDTNGKYDFIYDGGCLHHISPHRRPEYLKKIYNLLKKGGSYALEIFNEKGGANLTDLQVYTERSMCGGLAFSKFKLDTILSEYFTVKEIREMKDIKDGKSFGKNFCWVAIVEK